ncbi:hypothetical protein LJC60_05085 [Ruminococcaceae bacterium OttesenSCG-928-D13]|nr:hypothetical protein [Ruminococcaceae bacterium OttesenSCG-928-D13]
MANRRFEDSTEREAMQRTVIAAMLTLPDDQWLVLFHRYYNCLTIGRVAEVMDMSREKVRKLEARAIRALRHPDISRGLRAYVE